MLNDGCFKLPVRAVRETNLQYIVDVLGAGELLPAYGTLEVHKQDDFVSQTQLTFRSWVPCRQI